MRKRFIALSLLSGLAAFTLTVMPVYAETTTEDTATDNASASPEETTYQERKSELRKQLREEAVARKKERLDATKLKVCEKRQATITSILDKRVTQAEKHMAVFDKIAQRVKTYYEDKNLSVANYDQLVATIDGAKVKAEASLAEVKAASTFNCDSEDPKATVTDFKTYHKQLRQDLKAYRTSIKELIVAVKSSQEGGLN